MAHKRFRLAAIFVAAALFVAGASLATALSALAEDGVDATTDSTVATTAPGPVETAATTTDAAPPDPTTSEETPSGSATAPAEGSEEPPPATPALPADDQDPEPSGSTGSSSGPRGGHHPAPVLAPTHHATSPEIETQWAYATIWLHRVLPDPTPPARRLAPAFARRLRLAAEQAGVHWSLVLAVLRASGHEGRFPAGHRALEQVVRRLAHSRRGAVEDRVAALERYNRAVGLRALVAGLEAAKPSLERRVLRDRRIDVYPAGRGDIASGGIDVRVLVLARYLAVTFDQVTISSLHSGHRYYASPGVVSAHVYGLAVDIAAVGGFPISGHQQQGSITERAVTAILRLPAELQPQQVISLLGLGGSSFALADHYDHIHVGF